MRENKMGDQIVYCAINSKTGEGRRRDLIFMYNGTQVRLVQELNNSASGVWYHEFVIPAYSCDECSGFSVTWADDVESALQLAKRFAEKSRPHWQKYDTDIRKETDLWMYDCIDLRDPYWDILKDTGKELETLITNFFKQKARAAGVDLTTDVEIEFKRQY
jgi:hypothetical protein